MKGENSISTTGGENQIHPVPPLLKERKSPLAPVYKRGE